MSRTPMERLHDKSAEVRRAEANGEVADSLDVRKELLARVERGEITLDQCQAELRSIRRGAKRAGKITRGQAWRRG